MGARACCRSLRTAVVDSVIFSAFVVGSGRGGQRSTGPSLCACIGIERQCHTIIRTKTKGLLDIIHRVFVFFFSILRPDLLHGSAIALGIGSGFSHNRRMFYGRTAAVRFSE